MAIWQECRYCDGGFYARTLDDGAQVCAHCGTEWDPIVVEEDDEDWSDTDESISH